MLFSNPLIAIAWIVAILIALTVHEFCHAYSAFLLGDQTAKREGRLTLNPISHIDGMGLIPLLLFGFGWAKPVPFNPYNLRDPKWDSVKIALAGPVSNLVMAVVASLILRGLFTPSAELTLLVASLFLSVLLNLFLFMFNLVPIHPLDGSKLFFALFDVPKYAKAREFVAVRGPQILIVLVFLAILTPLDVFFFVSIPAFATCDVLVGESCARLLSLIFSLT